MAWYFLGLDTLFARRNAAVKSTTQQPAKPKPATQAPASKQRAQQRPSLPPSTNQTVVLSGPESTRVRQEAAATIPRVLVKKPPQIGPDKLTDRGPGLSDAEILATLNEPTELLERDDVLSAQDPARTKPHDTAIVLQADTPTDVEIVIEQSPVISKSSVIKAGTHGKGPQKIDKTRTDTAEAAERALDLLLNRKPKSSGK